MDSDCSVSLCPYAGQTLLPLHETNTSTNEIKSAAIMRILFMI